MLQILLIVGWSLLLIPERASADEKLPGKALTLSHHPQLFLDDHMIAKSRNLKREMQQPTRHADNPLIRQEHPWEKRMIEIYGTVLFDAGQSKFRCWYVAAGSGDGVFDTPEGPVTVEYYQCYAESDDGIRWTKPMSSAKKFREYEKHNVVIPGGHGFCVMPTPDDPDPKRKFKGGGGANFGFSPDGLDWTLHNWRNAIGKNDTSTSIVQWNGEYLAFVRYQIKDPKWPGVMRGVGLSASTDFENWSPKELVFQTDHEDGYPWTQPYGISVTPYGDQLIGLIWLLHLDEVENNNSRGDMDVQLMTSRDGRMWQRTAARSPLLSPVPNSWEQGCVFPGTSMFVKDDVIHIYYTGKNARHGTPGAYGIGLATLPVDRFVAMRRENADEAGELQTPLLDVVGQTLVVNADIGERDLQVELLDAKGSVVPGFDRESSHVKKRDDLRSTVSWRDGDSERHVGDRNPQQPVSIRFIVRNGSLFSFQIQH